MVTRILLYSSFLLYFILLGFYYHGTREHAVFQGVSGSKDIVLLYESISKCQAKEVEKLNNTYNLLRSENDLKPINVKLLSDSSLTEVYPGDYRVVEKKDDSHVLNYIHITNKEVKIVIEYPLDRFFHEGRTLFVFLAIGTLITLVIIYLIVLRYSRLTQKKEKTLKKANKKMAKQLVEIDRKDKMLIKQSKLAAVGEMIAVIAHQWKQPLNSLNLMVSDLEDAYEYKEIDKDYIRNLQGKAFKKINFMSRTINDFKDFFKPNKNKHIFNVFKSIESVLEILSATLEKSKVNVSVVGDTNIEIITVKGEFEQVVLNIINNGKDALVENNVKDRKIDIEIKEENRRLYLIIKDNGGGIPKEYIRKIFDSYFSTKGEEGTGIGLYMSKMIVHDSLGGDLSVKNDQDGAVFTIELPIR
ncbi:MAG: HAMP domain-containing histidine kinase [Campylobacterales bacterium]|nr:HAMP domain-containing histidine kinase [Campylobacterales bacterium]